MKVGQICFYEYMYKEKYSYDKDIEIILIIFNDNKQYSFLSSFPGTTFHYKSTLNIVIVSTTILFLLNLPTYTPTPNIPTSCP